MRKSITVNTVQGIGDIFWVYQKLAPHFEEIHVNILCLDMGPVQTRAEPFCRMLPKVKSVSYRRVPAVAYHAVASTRFALDDVMRRAEGGPVDYAVNAPLEVGVALRDIDPGMAVEDFVDLGQPARTGREDYLCVFVAGAKNGTVWTADVWLPHIKRLAKRLGTTRIDLIGAQWDLPVQEPIRANLAGCGWDVRSHVAIAKLPATIDVIRRSRFFLGYQSGLSILADNYDVPQLMVYFEKLRQMQYTWCRPWNARTLFHATTFADDVGKVIEALPLDAIAQQRP